MKKQLILNIIVIAAILALGYLHFNQKQDKIAYIEINKMMANYQGMKDAKIEFDHKKAVWMTKVDTLQAELQQGIQEYEKNRVTMSASQRKEAEMNLQKKQQELSSYNQVIQETIAKEQQEVTNRALAPADKIIKEYGKKHKLKIILGAMQPGYILYAEDAIDITQEIVEELNKQYSK